MFVIYIEEYGYYEGEIYRNDGETYPSADLEGKARKKLFASAPPKRIYVSSSRLKCAKNGKFEETGSSAAAYAWFVWEKGYKGDPTIKWIN